ncbi:hypothetical protein AMK31_10715 [Streptomyces sp. TSRI0107]|nr:hypothetical protein AMK31_10715 [Streptomyces sp. TSRI0107]
MIRSCLFYSAFALCKRTSDIVVPVKRCSIGSASHPSAFSAIATYVLLLCDGRFIPQHVEPSYFRLRFQASTILSKDQNDQRKETPVGEHRL